MVRLYNNYPYNGVIVIPNVIAEGDRVRVAYKGLLKNSGADAVYMRVGFGDNWQDLNDFSMDRTDEGFEAVVPVLSGQKLSLAFRDSANNWDNNSGRNYSFEVQTK